MTVIKEMDIQKSVEADDFKTVAINLSLIKQVREAVSSSVDAATKIAGTAEASKKDKINIE